MSPLSEKQTRKQLIDPKLEASGWKVVGYEPAKPLREYERCAIEEYPTLNGPADYALVMDGKILGIVEAKKLTLGPQNVLTQAERYSKGVENSPFNFLGYRVPFLYSTNGEVIWYHDVRHPLNRSRQIAKFHTPTALAEHMQSDSQTAIQNILQMPNEHVMLRPYQVEANGAIENAIVNKKHQMLVAMATGTGKTYTMVNQVYRLMKSGVAKRILFLVDRRALAAQAVRSFASFEAEPGHKFDQIYEVYSQRFFRDDLEEDRKFDPKVLPGSYLLDPKPGHAFVYVCTIQRMTINLFGRNTIFALGDEEIDDDANKMDIPIHAFDLIIADECHRGYTSAELSVWRNTLDHFDAIKIGLTATPAAHTTAYFKDIVFRYGYERAVRDGYLVDYDAVNIFSDVKMNGIFLQEGEHVGVVDPDSGVEQMDLLEDERKFETQEIEEKVTAPDSNQKILEEVKTYCDTHQQKFGRFPKTLIFAVNDIPHISHCDQLVDIARDVFGRGDAFVQKITGRVDRPLQRIREFRNRKEPGIVVTVDMLSTGVDIPDLEFIVFLRPVKSRILFEQMLGRGTRKGEHFPDKSHFVVFDCFDGSLLEYFKQATGITAEPLQTEYRTIIQIIEDIWQNKDRNYNIRCLIKRLHRINKEMSGEARDLFARYIPNGDVAQFAINLPQSLHDDFTGTMAILRDPDFQNLLINYPRPPRTFVKAYETKDMVYSTSFIRDNVGNEWKPEDYLTEFTRFVQENPEHIEAIRILSDRPQDWNPNVLAELRNKLASNPKRFTIENLQKAHEKKHNKALVDIISMVKHAVHDQEPLLTAEERVSQVFHNLMTDQSFTSAQLQWLERIRDHLVANLSIDREDFENIPVFNHAGGWGRANKDFDKKLPDLIQKCNEAIAA